MTEPPEMMTEPGLRHLVLNEIRRHPEPVSAKAIEKKLNPPADGEKELLGAEIDALVATGALHVWSQTSKDRKIWIHAPGPYAHDKLVEVLSDRPLTENETLKALAQVQSTPAIPKEAIKSYIAQLVEQGQLYLVGKKLFGQHPKELIRNAILRVLEVQPVQPTSVAAIAKAVSERVKFSVKSGDIGSVLAQLVDERKIFKLKSNYLAHDPAEIAEAVLAQALMGEPDRVFSKRELVAQLKAQTPLSLTATDLEGMIEKLIANGQAFRHGKDKFGARAAPLSLEQQLLRCLQTQREQGGNAYPVTLTALADHCQVSFSDERLQQLLTKGRNPFRQGTVLGAQEPTAETLVVLKEDADRLVDSFAYLRAILEAGVPSDGTTTPEKLMKAVPASLRASFKKAFDRRLAEETLPAGIAWLRFGSAVSLFRTDNLYPKSIGQKSIDPGARADRTATAPPPVRENKPARPFEPVFNEAFDRLDRQRGSNNLVSLVDLRRELKDFSHEDFDLGIWSLRQAGKFSLRPADGRHGISQDEREAGFVEAGTLLLNVSRRSQ